METALTIQQVAKQTGLSIDTLRYYERIGLLEPVGRAQNGHRRYTQHDIDWIDLLIRLRNTGMPRAKMVRFAQLRRQGSATLTERRLMLLNRAKLSSAPAIQGSRLTPWPQSNKEEFVYDYRCSIYRLSIPHHEQIGPSAHPAS